MKNIKETIKNQSVTFDDLIECFEQIKNEGNVVVIKFDGEREENKYTAFISFPNQPLKELIRKDGNDLRKVLLNILNMYIEQN